MEYLLEDITVIDAATFLAGPGAATILADFGANVIKIEPPGGDGYRRLNGGHEVPYHWLLTSRNKRSLALDLSKDEGQTLMHQLIKKADVLTTNFMQAQLQKYQLEYKQVKQLNPRLIYAHISGYGLEGQEADRRAFDITGWWARSGIMDFVRDPGQTPIGMAPGMGDHATATTLFGAIMTGLYRRERTGEGSMVSTSLAANGVWANGMAIQGVVAGTNIGEYRQAKGWPNPFTQAYACADGEYIVLAAVNTHREYPKLAQALGRGSWLEQPEFADARAVMKNRDAFREQMSVRFAQLTYAEAELCLENAGITYARVQPMADVLTDQQLRDNGIVIETGDTEGGYDLTIASPINVVEEEKKAPSRAPDIGADTLTVLRDLGFEQDYLSQLLDQGVILDGA